MKFKKSMKNSMLLQIIFYYLIGNFLFILFLSSIFYYTSKYIIMNKEIEYTNENVTSTARYITLYVDKHRNIINLLAVDADIKGFLTTGNKNYRQNIDKMISLILNSNTGIKNITVIGKNGNIVSSDKVNNMNISTNMMKEKWYIDAINNSDMPVFNPIRKNSATMNSDFWFLSISHDIKNENNENLGVIVFDIKYEILEKYLNTLAFGKQSDSIIVDENDNIIYYKDVNCFINKKCLEKFSEKNLKSKDMYLSTIKIENTNWRLKNLANMNDLITLKKNFLHMVITIFLVSLVFSSVIAFIAITKFLRPLINLEKHMQESETTLSEFQLKEDTGYEINNLIEHFNAMIRKIKYLRKYEIKALHSQINPHFLYNTLDTIIWMAEFKDEKKVIAITKALANFFRISLSNGNEMILLKDEIKHVQEYLFIQKQRYEDKLSYSFNVDETLLSAEVPKIILQPVVENSIYHGIKNIPGNGLIKIDVYKKDDSINISVKDNGIGFKKSKNFKKNKIGGVGIQNVDKRIKFYYGKKYGIFISKPNEGAEVIIKIPLNK